MSLRYLDSLRRAAGPVNALGPPAVEDVATGRPRHADEEARAVQAFREGRERRDALRGHDHVGGRQAQELAHRARLVQIGPPALLDRTQPVPPHP